MGKVEKINGKCVGLANWFEPMIAAFTFRDAPLSIAFAAVLAGFAVAASVFVGLVAALCSRIGVGWNHLTLCAGLLCFHPRGAPMTRAILDTIDGYLELIAAVATLRPLTWGPGLACTAPKPDTLTDMSLTGDALRDAIKRETEATVAATLAAKEALRVAHSSLRPVSLTARDIMGFEWLPRLLERAPNVPRETHCAMLAQASSSTELLPPKPHRSLSLSASLSRRRHSGPESPPATPQSSKRAEDSTLQQRTPGPAE